MKVTVASAAAVLLLAATASYAEPSHSAPAKTSRRGLKHHSEMIARQNSLSNHRNTTAFDLEVSQDLAKRGASGSATYYETNTGNQGSCGNWLSDTDFTVALATPGWSVNPNACHQTIVITLNGVTRTARIEDTCPSGWGPNCNGPCDLDMTPALFKQFTNGQGLGPGKLYGMSWYYQSSGLKCDGGHASSGGGGGGGGGDNNGGGNNDGGNNNNNGDDGNSWADQQAAKSSSAAAAASSSASASKASASKAAASSAAKASSAASAKSASKHSSYLSAKSASSAAAAQASAQAKLPQNVNRLSDVFQGLQMMAYKANDKQ